MALAASSARRSARPSLPPLSLADEQAASVLSQLEQRDVAAALRLSLQDSWDSDEEKSEADGAAEAASSSEEEEEERKADAAAEVEGQWTSHLHAIELPLPRLRHAQQQSPPDDTTPLQLLQMFLPPGLMEEFAEHTNAAAPQGWRPTTAAELYAFLGAHVYMGIDRLPRTDLYWNAAFQHSRLTSAFSRDRFKQLLRYFRVVPVDDADEDRDPLPYVRPLADRLNRSFAAHYTPSRFLALDEAMVAFKGRSPIKQYIPSKPHKWGYKIYCLASDDYLLRFEVYEGKSEERSEHGSTYDLALRMTDAYQDQQLVLCTDNWFTSPDLLNALQRRGIRLCGSVRRNRKGMPHIDPDDIKALGRGDYFQRQKGDMCLAVWHDQKPVWVLYNHCSPTELASLDRWSEAGNKISVACPRAIHDYFYQARSVDVLSQLHYSYLIGRKARRVWPRLAWWLLDVCILNAFQLWSMGMRRPDHLDFRIRLMYELMEMHEAEQRAGQVQPQPHAAHALVKDHFPEHVAEKRDCVVCSHEPEHRVQSRIICHACQVHLCLGPCFARYHT